jgi:hypothetical protein
MGYSGRAAASQGNVCDTAARQAARAHGVPADVLLALTRAETGRTVSGDYTPWPWTVNVGGEGRWFQNMTSALSFVNEQLASGRRSIDVGCFQINIRWHGQNFGSLSEMFDPQQNANHAATYLKQMFERSGDWLSAAGAYHSKTPEFAMRYKARFETILSDLAEAPRQPSAGFLQAGQPLRQSGGSAQGIGSLVPVGPRDGASAFIRF